MATRFREISFTRCYSTGAEPFEADTDLIFHDDGPATRLVKSRLTSKVLEIPVIGTAIEYERRLLAAKMTMAEADEKYRESSKSS